MIDKEILTSRLEHLRQYAGYLKDYQRYTIEEIGKDPTLRGAIERYLQLSAECVIDIAEHIISGLKVRRPEDYRDSIIILGEEGVIPVDFAVRFAPLAGFRNILVHEYTKIDLKKVYKYLKESLGDFDMFAKYIAEFIKKGN